MHRNLLLAALLFTVLPPVTHAQCRPDSLARTIDARLSSFDSSHLQTTSLRGRSPYFGDYTGEATTDAFHHLKLCLFARRGDSLILYCEEGKLIKICLPAHCYYRSATGYVDGNGVIDSSLSEMICAAEVLAQNLIGLLHPPRL